MTTMGMRLPRIEVGKKPLSDFDRAIGKEWLVTNGLGGYASSTVLGINTRKYHGLMVAAFNPPVDRRVLLSKLDEEIRVENQTYYLGSNEFRNNINPQGHRHLTYFALDPLPTYKYVAEGIQLQKTVFTPHGMNMTVVVYEVTNPRHSDVVIRITPLVNSRHFHAVTDKREVDWTFTQEPFDWGVTIQPSIPTSTLIVASSCSRYKAQKGNWVERIYYRAEDSRGESCLDDAFQPGWFDIPVDSSGKKRFCLIVAGGEREEETRKAFSTFSKEPTDFDALYVKEVNRLETVLKTFQNQHTSMKMQDWLKWLVAATDAFVVNRRSTGRKSVIAGYPWFEDWGRDSLISLPGLTLVTGRFSEAREILLTFKQYCRKGTIPNKFPDQAGDKPIYNTVDASLWFFNAVLQYLKYTGNFSFVREELLDTLESIVRYHVQGTPQGIRVDGDGLVQHGPRLTWMDAKANDQAVTPRQGKAVEIQALWYNALKTMELLSTAFNQEKEAAKYCAMAEKASKSFIGKFWNVENGFLYDAVQDGVGDPSLRPNQVIAVSLDFSMLDAMEQNAVVETAWKKLWGGYGLRTLVKDDARYTGAYIGDRYYRDNAYHNGTVWAWLLGPFVTAFLKVKKCDKEWRKHAFERFLQPLFCKETFQAGLGTISEIFDGDPPHRSRGCFAQAWSVAEPLRAFVEDVMLNRPPHEREILSSESVDY